MIKNMILVLMETVFVCTLCEMIFPEGNMKKYFRLVLGFTVMCVVLKPVGQFDGIEPFRFQSEKPLDEAEIKAESEAYILRLHKENIERKVYETVGGECKVFANVSSDGSVVSISIVTDNITLDTINQIKQEIGCDDIRILSGDNDES